MEELEFPRKECDTLDTSEDIEFQIIDWYIPESDRAVDFYNRRDGYKNGAKPQIYSMYIYGVTEKGESVCCKINDFEPYFYLKAPASWKNYKTEIQKLTHKLCEEKMERKRFNKSSYISTIIPYRLKEHLVYIKKVKRKDYWGFTNRQEFPFLKVRVKSLSLFNILKRWFGEKEQKEAGWGLYGSNLDPFFRYIHEQKIEPCGWIKLVGDTYTLMSESDDTMSDDSNKEAENISRTNHNICVSYKNVIPCNYNKVAPFLIASFDIECTSSHGDFPVAKKNYKKLASDIISVARYNLDNFKENIGKWIIKAFHEDVVVSRDITINKLFIKKNEVKPETLSDEIKNTIITIVVSILSNLKNNKRPIIEDNESENSDEEIDEKTEGTLIEYLNKNLPKLKGDPIIQIGTTVSRFGSDEIIYKHLVGLKKTDDIDNIEIESYNQEKTVLLKWKEFIQRLDPDILTGYNIFGFDMKYIWERAEELDILDEFSVGLGRMQGRKTILDKKELSSSALGDNVMYYFDMDGVVLIDMFKVMQRDHKLDSYKLDFVANTFLQDKKDDLKPREIFEKYKGSSEDRAVIAKYCIQDCALCNRLMHKLKVLGNNIGMGNVCYVPLSYLFMRGQGIKIFSLVSRECYMKNYIIPTIGGNIDRDAPEVGYEGAIVLDPKCDMYLEDPVTVFDYSSLYPSCMISRNLSHDAFVNDEKYANMQDEGITYETIEYDIYEGVGDKKKSIGKKKCVFAQFQNGEKGILPTILMDLLKNRKITRKKIEYETLTLNDGSEVIGGIAKNDKEEDIEDEEGNIKVSDVETGKVTKVKKADIVSRKDTYTYFEQAVLDALQLAYKITANSLYGQTGSRFSQIYLKEIAACTTATGREMIYLAKNFMEKEYGVDVVYGDTDSILCKFPLSQIPKEERLQKAIEMGMKAEKAVKAVLPMYQSLAYEKVLFPLILLSKKRYIGNLYEKDPKKYKIKSMGVVLKRRDNAQIVKIIYGGVINILLNKNDLQGSVEFLQSKLQEMVDGKIDIKDLIISKTLKGSYKDPTKIAHKVLADRMGERDEGNKPMVNDRVPFVYIIPPEGTEIKLQGDRIEHPDYIKEKGLKPDYYFYITNQLLKPLCQLYSLCITRLPNYSFPESYWYQIDEELLGKELYKNDKKRATRIDNMKMNEVTDLLFKEYLDKLTPVKMIKKVVAKRPKIEGKLVLAEINTKYELRIESTLKKRGGGKNPYQYAIDIKLLNGEEEIWKEIYELNGDKMRTLIVGTKKALYHIIQNYEEQIKEIKIVGNKDLIYEWKRIMKMNISRDDAIERRKKAYNDSGEVDEMNRVLDIIELIEFYDIIKYNLQNI